ncbi:UNVERIFIED_CONTAM: hypothetical protein FKN15_013832 [Acipenser sinensis]
MARKILVSCVQKLRKAAVCLCFKSQRTYYQKDVTLLTKFLFMPAVSDCEQPRKKPRLEINTSNTFTTSTTTGSHLLSNTRVAQQEIGLDSIVSCIPNSSKDNKLKTADACCGTRKELKMDTAINMSSNKELEIGDSRKDLMLDTSFEKENIQQRDPIRENNLGLSKNEDVELEGMDVSTSTKAEVSGTKAHGLDSSNHRTKADNQRNLTCEKRQKNPCTLDTWLVKPTKVCPGEMAEGNLNTDSTSDQGGQAVSKSLQIDEEDVEMMSPESLPSHPVLCEDSLSWAEKQGSHPRAAEESPALEDEISSKQISGPKLVASTKADAVEEPTETKDSTLAEGKGENREDGKTAAVNSNKPEKTGSPPGPSSSSGAAKSSGKRESKMTDFFQQKQAETPPTR